jgi:hypothetical protein
MSVERTLAAGLGAMLAAVSAAVRLPDGPRKLLAALGWDLPPGVDDIGLAALDLGAVGDRLTAWARLAAAESPSTEDELVAVAELAEALGAAVLDLSHVHLVAPQEYLDRAGIVDAFLPRLSALYLIQAVGTASRPLLDLVLLLGLAEVRPEPADPAHFQVAHLRHVVHWDRFTTLVTDPAALFAQVYGWGTPAFDSNTLVSRLGSLLRPLAADVRRRDLPAFPLSRLQGGTPPPAPAQLQLFLTLFGATGPLAGETGLTVFGLPPTTPGGADGGLGFAPYADGTAQVRIPLSSRLSIGLSAGADLGTGIALVLRPRTDPVLRTGLNADAAGTGGPGAKLDVDLTLAVPAGTDPVTLLAASGVLVTARSVGAAVSVAVDGGGTDATVRLTVTGGKLALTGTGLAFVDSVLPPGGLSADADLTLTWSHRDGLRLDGRAELRTSRAVSLRLGPLTLDSVDVALGIAGNGVALRASAAATLRLGPVLIVAAGMGVRAAITPGPGSLGAADLTVRPSAPDSLGITIDAAVASGGGFLFRGEDGHSYAGVLDLKLGPVQVKALGILDTDPGTAPGWSLLLLLFAQFADPVPLGFGFSLSGVGGVVGLNFGVGVDPLRAALGTGDFDDVLFPADPVANAPRIIGRLRSFFPPSPGTLVIGPAVEITWGGVIPLVTARLALLAQIAHVSGGGSPRFDRLVALGTIRAAAPGGDLPVPPTIRLVADLLGVYDAQSGLLAIDAQLRDSVIAGVAVGGTVIVRVGLGGSSGGAKAFALSAGGFHPDFTDLPPNLPARIDRISLTWTAGGGTSIRLQLRAYVALTAATIQLGAAFELKASVGPVTLDGQLGFDLLVNADHSFSAHIVGRVGIRYHGHTLAGIGLDMMLSRSARHVWRVRGTATFEILWWDIDVDFDDSWGQAASLPEPRVQIAARVRAALADPTNWTPALPGGDAHMVSLVTGPSAGGPSRIAHPLGQLRIAQQLAPLGLDLDHVDDAVVDGARRITFTGVRIGVGGPAQAPLAAQDPFTRARFQRLDEGQRLRSRSFESMPSGVVVGDAGFVAPAGIELGAGHETRLLGPIGGPPPTGPAGPPLPLPGEWLTWHLSSSAAATSPLREAERTRPAVSTSLSPQGSPLAMVHPGTVRSEPLDPSAQFSEALAEQAARAAGLRVVERWEAQS